MRAGLVRNAALGMVALVGLGLAGCDDNPTDFDSDETTHVRANPTNMVVPAGATSRLDARTENAGNEPTWEEVTWQVDASCGSGAITVNEHPDYVPDVEPPVVLGVTGGTTLGGSCVQLTGGGQNITVEVTVVGDSMEITDVPAAEVVNLFETHDLSATLLGRDGSAVSPFDPNADVAWSSDNPAAMTVDPATGVVEAIGVGSASISATWTDAGATVTASTALTTNAPTLAVVEQGTSDPVTDSLLIDTTVDLEPQLIDPTDPPATFGPFDPEADVTWVTFDEDGDPTDDNGIVSVDPVTGLVTAVGPGSATVQATWDATVVVDEDDAVINNPVTGSVTINVNVPAPSLTSATPNSGDLGDVITLTGTGFHEAMSIIVGEDELESAYEPTIVDATTATFHLPFGDDGDVEVRVGATGQLSDPVTVSRTITPDATEPDNDSRATAPPITFPVDRWGTVDGVDLNDRFFFTLAAETTLDVSLDWAGASGDLDLLWVDSPPTAFQACTGDTATGAHPETAECTFPAGDYTVEVNTYDEASAVYHLEITVVP